MYGNISHAEIVRVLDGIAQQGGGARPALQLTYDDGRVRWQDICQCSNHGLPAINHGQKRDCRWSLSDGRSLHAHWFDGYSRFHIDRIDPTRDGLGHLARDTKAFEGAAIGGLVAALLGLTFGAAGASGGLALGAAVGAAIGAHAGSAPTTLWRLDSYGYSGEWRASRIAAGRLVPRPAPR